jgi:hypothetical protein
MTSEERERMNQLCERIQIEKDTHRFTALVEQLNQLLEQTHRNLDSRKPKAS